jgi:hypothetical protein
MEVHRCKPLAIKHIRSPVNYPKLPQIMKHSKSSEFLPNRNFIAPMTVRRSPDLTDPYLDN